MIQKLYTMLNDPTQIRFRRFAWADRRVKVTSGQPNPMNETVLAADGVYYQCDNWRAVWDDFFEKD